MSHRMKYVVGFLLTLSPLISNGATFNNCYCWYIKNNMTWRWQLYGTIPETGQIVNYDQSRGWGPSLEEMKSYCDSYLAADKKSGRCQ